METLKVAESDLAEELRRTRDSERALTEELRRLGSGQEGRRECLEEVLIPRTRRQKLELQEKIARGKARSFAQEAAPSRERFERAKIALVQAQNTYEAARNEWAALERCARGADWQAERIGRLLRELESEEQAERND
jgi:hypothetical protein